MRTNTFGTRLNISIPQTNRSSSSPLPLQSTKLLGVMLQAPQRPGRNARASTVSARTGETDADLQTRPSALSPPFVTLERRCEAGGPRSNPLWSELSAGRTLDRSPIH